MKINWILRLKNKAVLTALVGSFITLVYQLLSIFGVTPSVSESTVVETAGIVVNMLVMLGIVVDPSTKGVSDPSNVMEYTEPRDESVEALG